MSRLFLCLFLSLCVNVLQLNATVRMHRHMHDVNNANQNVSYRFSNNRDLSNHHHRVHHHSHDLRGKNASFSRPHKQQTAPTKAGAVSSSISSQSLKLTLINSHHYPTSKFRDWPSIYEDPNRNSIWNFHNNVGYQPGFYATPVLPVGTTTTTTTTIRPFKDPRMHTKHFHG